MKRVNYIFKACMGCLLALFLVIAHFDVLALAAEEEAEETKEPAFNSVVEISDYWIDEGFIAAGKEANISLTLHNANKHSAANGLAVQFTSNSGMVYPAYGNDNQFYVGTLEAGESTILSIPITVNSNFNADYADFTCYLSYETGGSRITNQLSMILPSANISSVAVKSVDVSAHAIKNGKSLLSINYSNNSTENINDAELVIDGNVSETSRNIKLDTVLAGKNYTKDFNIVYTQEGQQTITITLRYTDANGEQVETELGTYDVVVDKEHVSEVVEQSENVTLKWIGRAITIGGLAAVFVAILIYIKKK